MHNENSNTKKIFTPTDIKWFKNVTNSTNRESYLNSDENPFVIHFPNNHKTNAESPSIGDLILIYQKVEGVPSFTHLVTPVDDELVEDTTRDEFRYGRRVRSIAKKEKDSVIHVSDSPLWKNVHLGGITQGNACQLKNVKGISNLDELLLDVWERFEDSFIESDKQSVVTTNSLVDEVINTYPEITVAEGRLRLVSHMLRERNRKIVEEKKAWAEKNGLLKCEVCSFSFFDKFGVKFIECHHIEPISSMGERETKLDNLALVCSNCHRMLHRKFGDTYLSIDDLRKIMK
jgi:hypothetical protein